MALFIYNGWVITHQYNDNRPFAFIAYCENDPERTTSGSTMEEVKDMIDLRNDK
jgi:hypothetical protein